MIRPRSSRRRIASPAATVAGAALLMSLAAGAAGRPAGLQDGEGATGGAAGDRTGSTTPGRVTVVPAYRKATKVGVLTIHGAIDHVSLISLERRVAEAMKDGCDAIAFDIDTPGGRVDAALDITNLIKTDAPINTVAWVHPNAYSAGTLISLACREIVVAPNARWGDCAPIAVALGTLMQMPPAERAKLEAPLRGEVVDSARRNHYDERLVEAFISVGVEIWMLEHKQTGERIFVDRREYKVVFGEDQEPPDLLQSATPPTAPAGPAVRPWYNSRYDGLPDTGLPPTDEEMRELVEREQTLPTVRRTLTAADRNDWKLVTQIISNDRLLIIGPAESIDYGLAMEVIRTDAELAAYFGVAPTGLVRYDESWSEGLVRFMVNPLVRGLLIVIFLIGLFVELAAPGLGVFGGAAAVALLLLIGAPALVGMADWWEIVAILLGLGLVAAEIFVIPGTGLAGISGALLVLIGLVATFITGDVTTPQGQGELMTGLGATIAACFLGGVGIWMLSKHLGSFPVFNKLVLSPAGISSEPAGGGRGLLESMAAGQRALNPGDAGLAESDLRPSGRASFEGRVVDVVTVGEYITKGSPVRVTSVGRFRIEVEDAGA